MDKSEISTGLNDGSKKKLKGLRDDGIIDLMCPNCRLQLLCLQLTSIAGNTQSRVLTRVVVKCCSCDCYSDVEQVSGQFFPGAPSDNMGFDIDDDPTEAPEADLFFKAWRK